MVISDHGIEMIKEYEGCYLTAYQCAAGVWTIGYGTTEPINGEPIQEGMTITQEEADRLLRENIKMYERAIRENTRVPLNQNHFDALVSLTYNIGCEAYKSSTLLKMLNQYDYYGAADQFLRWNKVNGKTLTGLTRRRESERKVFLTPVRDDELENALDKMIKSGIDINKEQWKSIELIKMAHVPSLLKKLNKSETLNNPSDVRRFIINYAKQIT